MKLTRQIPNFITLCHLLSGCVAIIMIFSGQIYYASLLVFLSAILDFLDGFAARLLKADSEIGAQLDSLADMVTFGVVPGLILYQLLASSFRQDNNAMEHSSLLFMPGLLIAVCSAVRLAKFNVRNNQTDHFIGLPTPAAGIFIGSLPLIFYNKDYNLGYIVLNKAFLYAVTFLFSYLLISRIKMINIKFKDGDYSWKSNKYKYIFVIIALILVIVFKTIAAPMIILVYIIYSIINYNFLKQ